MFKNFLLCFAAIAATFAVAYTSDVEVRTTVSPKARAHATVDALQAKYNVCDHCALPKMLTGLDVQGLEKLNNKTGKTPAQLHHVVDLLY